MKVSVIFGTRPEAIKLAPVILALKRHPETFNCRICITAQHREMLDQVLDIFEIIPDVDLNLMESDQTLAGLTSKAIIAIDSYLKQDKPDFILVQGDTTTVFCAALAGFYNKIPVGHVEAGLRTWNMYAPWPEELNRVMASRLATLHFTPTEWSRNNLRNEGISLDKIFITGNTVIDALLIAVEKLKDTPVEIPGLDKMIQKKLGKTSMVLITGHRRENFGEGFMNICNAIYELSVMFPETQFIYPVHLNPNVQEPVLRILGKTPYNNVHLIPPLSYLPFIKLMNYSTIILSDSGGIQEEAPTLGKPLLIMRELTERPEAIEAGVAKLVGTDKNSIIKGVTDLLSNRELYSSMAKFKNPYGDGTASERIVSVLSMLESK